MIVDNRRLPWFCFRSDLTAGKSFKTRQYEEIVRRINMGVEIIDLVELARQEKRRKVVFDTPRCHAWVHYYPSPGERDDMHCHNADQTFYVIDGECTMHFPDGGKAVMKPGMVATITGGSFYQLENSGDGPMIMMGNRSGPSEAIQHINYELREDIKKLSKEELERANIPHISMQRRN
jgi:mannose-6-phosphate isomerase-like protein (cupin superfamily)